MTPPFDDTPEGRMRAAGGTTEAHAPRQSDKGSGDSTPDLPIVCPADLESAPVPERAWIVQDWLPVRHVTASYGDGGVGKTLLAQQLQTACATATPWCGLAVERCRSLALFCEDDTGELHRRQDAICRAMGLRFSEMADMHWISGVGTDNMLATFASDGRITATERFHQLRDAAISLKVRLVILDTAADLFGGNENDRGQVRRFIGLLSGLALDINGAVLLNAHPSRSGLNSGTLDGGSTAWSNTVRSRWSLARPDVGENAEQDTNERVLTRRKSNYSAIGGTIKLRWVNGVLVPVTPEGGIAGSVHRAAVEAVFLELLDKCSAQNVNVSASDRASNFAPKIFAGRPDAQGYAVPDFTAAMKRLFAEKRVRNGDYGRPSDARQRIVRDGAQPEEAAA